MHQFQTVKYIHEQCIVIFVSCGICPISKLFPWRKWVQSLVSISEQEDCKKENYYYLLPILKANAYASLRVFVRTSRILMYSKFILSNPRITITFLLVGYSNFYFDNSQFWHFHSSCFHVVTNFWTNINIRVGRIN